jgi:hypothetical protein
VSNLVMTINADAIMVISGPIVNTVRENNVLFSLLLNYVIIHSHCRLIKAFYTESERLSMNIGDEIFIDPRTTKAMQTSEKSTKRSTTVKEITTTKMKTNLNNNDNTPLYATTKKGVALFELVTIKGIKKNSTKKFTTAKINNSTRHKIVSTSTIGFDPNRRLQDPFEDYFHREFKNVYNHKGLDKKNFKDTKNVTKKINGYKSNSHSHNLKHRKGGGRGKHHKSTTKHMFTLPMRTLASTKLSTNKYKFLKLNNSRYQQIKKRLENANIANAEDLALNLANVDTIYINEDDDYEFQLTTSIVTTKASKSKNDGDDDEDYESDAEDDDDESDDDEDDDDEEDSDGDADDNDESEDDEDDDDDDDEYEDDYDDEDDEEETDYSEKIGQEKSNSTDKSLIDICKLSFFV